MMKIKDFRETKVYQEALEEGRQKGLQEGRQKGREAVGEEVAIRLLAKKYPVAEVADLTGLAVQRVRMLKKKTSNGA